MRWSQTCYLVSRAFARYHGVARECASVSEGRELFARYGTDIFDSRILIYFALEIFEYACLHHGDLVAGHDGHSQTDMKLNAKGEFRLYGMSFNGRLLRLQKRDPQDNYTT